MAMNATEKAELLAKLESDHKRVAYIKGKPYPKQGEDPDAVGPAWEIVLRKPTRAEYKRFRAQINNPATMPDATEMLARSCVVYPSREAFDALLEDFPAIPEAAGAAIKELIGLAVDETEK